MQSWQFPFHSAITINSSSMTSNIDYDIIKANFADLLSRGIVSYETAEVVRLEDAGFKVGYIAFRSYFSQLWVES
jgi:hypothetical protein